MRRLIKNKEDCFKHDRSKKEISFIRHILFDKKIFDFITIDLKKSLSGIGFSKNMIDDLIEGLGQLKKFSIARFTKEYSHELTEIHTVSFFQKFTQDYFEKYLVPEIPLVHTILDVGCGPGFFLRTLAKKPRFRKIIGIDIHPYPEWKNLRNNRKIELAVINEPVFKKFIKKTAPNVIILTWTLHHMRYDEQVRYLNYIKKQLTRESMVVILEDAYSNGISPMVGANTARKFFHLTPKERKNIMCLYDWVANRILAKRRTVPIPFAYRTVEEWKNLLLKVGFRILKKKFIGFPKHRDINTPQGLILAKR